MTTTFNNINSIINDIHRDVQNNVCNLLNGKNSRGRKYSMQIMDSTCSQPYWTKYGASVTQSREIFINNIEGDKTYDQQIRLSLRGLKANEVLIKEMIEYNYGIYLKNRENPSETLFFEVVIKSNKNEDLQPIIAGENGWESIQLHLKTALDYANDAGGSLSHCNQVIRNDDYTALLSSKRFASGEEHMLDILRSPDTTVPPPTLVGKDIIIALTNPKISSRPLVFSVNKSIYADIVECDIYTNAASPNYDAKHPQKKPTTFVNVEGLDGAARVNSLRLMKNCLNGMI